MKHRKYVNDEVELIEETAKEMENSSVKPDSHKKLIIGLLIGGVAAGGVIGTITYKAISNNQSVSSDQSLPIGHHHKVTANQNNGLSVGSYYGTPNDKSGK